MATTSQIQANQVNALSSTGPRTAEGINASKYNATRHGLTGKQIVIRGEDPVHYESLRNSLVAELKPAGEMEAMLVEEIAQNWWRLERARRAESQLLEKIDLGAAMTDRVFMNLQRYMSRIERCYTRARQDLQRRQSTRAKAAVRSMPTPIGFVSLPTPPLQKSVSETDVSSLALRL